MTALNNFQNTQNHTSLQPSLSVDLKSSKLVLTICFLATGESFRSLSYQFRISERTVSYIIEEVAKAITTYVGKDYIKILSSQEEWFSLAKMFCFVKFPKLSGAIDVKHIIKPPPGTGSEFFNYNKSFSVILLAITRPDYECLYAYGGSNGRMNDSGVWNNSDLRRKFENDGMNVPDPNPLPFVIIRVPYVFVGDDAFTLKNYMMKPFSRRDLTTERQVYNYRQSRARRFSEKFFWDCS